MCLHQKSCRSPPVPGAVKCNVWLHRKCSAMQGNAGDEQNISQQRPSSRNKKPLQAATQNAQHSPITAQHLQLPRPVSLHCSGRRTFFIRKILGRFSGKQRFFLCGNCVFVEVTDHSSVSIFETSETQIQFQFTVPTTKVYILVSRLI